jgi:hypothetical protein
MKALSVLLTHPHCRIVHAKARDGSTEASVGDCPDGDWFAECIWPLRKRFASSVAILHMVIAPLKNSRIRYEGRVRLIRQRTQAPPDQGLRTKLMYRIRKAAEF